MDGMAWTAGISEQTLFLFVSTSPVCPACSILPTVDGRAKPVMTLNCTAVPVRWYGVQPYMMLLTICTLRERYIHSAHSCNCAAVDLRRTRKQSVSWFFIYILVHICLKA